MKILKHIRGRGFSIEILADINANYDEKKKNSTIVFLLLIQML